MNKAVKNYYIQLLHNLWPGRMCAASGRQNWICWNHRGEHILPVQRLGSNCLKVMFTVLFMSCHISWLEFQSWEFLNSGHVIYHDLNFKTENCSIHDCHVIYHDLNFKTENCCHVLEGSEFKKASRMFWKVLEGSECKKWKRPPLPPPWPPWVAFRPAALRATVKTCNQSNFVPVAR